MKYLITALFALTSVVGFAQMSMPLIRSNKKVISIKEDSILNKDTWTITPEVKPDVHTVQIKGKQVRVTFITDVDSITYNVKPGDNYTFIVLLNGKDTAYTGITGRKYINPATFSNKYKKLHNGKTYTEIPEVYELTNIMLSITPSYIKAPGLVSRNAAYYPQVIDKFGPFAGEPEIEVMDSLLKMDKYFVLKMDAYAFEFNKKGKIVQSRVYDRSSWGPDNTLKPYLAQLQSFADKTHFREFYNNHKSYYNEQIKFYRDSANTAEMIRWLGQNFPGGGYNSFKIIWSPLVGNNQSANWMEDNGFKEMHAHVNFPYKTSAAKLGISQTANDMRRGDIVFTEINHSFINPEAAKPQYGKDIQTAFNDLGMWADGIAKNNYGSPYACFNEYMNWALVPLRYVDYAPAQDFDKLQANIDTMMVKYRGFKRFADFDKYLVNLYRNRKPGTTIAGLYPQVVNWFVTTAKAENTPN